MKFFTFLYNVAASAKTNFHDEISKIVATLLQNCGNFPVIAQQLSYK
jgi:hypothetical protein